MVSLLSNPEKVRKLLDAEHVVNAMLIDRIFWRKTPRRIVVDDIVEPHGVMVLSEADPKHICIYADNEKSLVELLRSLESGRRYQFSGLRDIYLPLMEKEFEIKEISPCWLFELGEEGVKGEIRHEIVSLTEEDVDTVAKNWEQFPGAYEHVRSRILEGETVAFRKDGKLIGWDATHFETDRVVMLGFLFVLEGYRKQGIATSLCTALTKRVLKKGKKPIFYVMKNNEPSISFSLKLGYEIIDSHSWTTGVKK